MMKQKYESELLGVIYEDALASYRVGAISEARLQEYARDCLAGDAKSVIVSAGTVSKRRPAPIAASSAK
jgi:hypothetical protein